MNGHRGGSGEPAIRPWLLWASLLATPVLWLVYFLAAYAYTEATCGAAGQAAAELGVTVRSVLLVGTLLVAAASVAATGYTLRLRGRARRTARTFDDFLPQLGVVMGALFTFVLLGHLVPLAIVPVCG